MGTSPSSGCSKWAHVLEPPFWKEVLIPLHALFPKYSTSSRALGPPASQRLRVEASPLTRHLGPVGWVHLARDNLLGFYARVLPGLADCKCFFLVSVEWGQPHGAWGFRQDSESARGSEAAPWAARWSSDVTQLPRQVPRGHRAKKKDQEVTVKTLAIPCNHGHFTPRGDLLFLLLENCCESSRLVGSVMNRAHGLGNT